MRHSTCARRTTHGIVPLLFSVLSLCALAALFARSAVAAPIDEAGLKRLVFPRPDLAAIRQLGPETVPALVRIYEKGNVYERSVVAYVFYDMKWKSDAAKQALMKDARSTIRDLRVSVQYALVHVSNDADVIDLLFHNMVNDPDAYVRDKSACALAHQTVPLSDEQRVMFYERLIRALRDPRKQVRSIVSRVLFDQTGQSKRYFPGGTEEEREAGVREWEAWLREYRANL